MTASPRVPAPANSAAISALGFVGWLVLAFSAAALGGLFPPGDWYARLQKPSWNPPNWVFGPVWTALYTLMAVAAWRVWRRGGFGTRRRELVVFLVHLVLNALWSPCFFGLHSPALGLAEIVLLWGALVATLVLFWRVDRLAGALFVPYLAWVSFAAFLNFTLWRLNP